MNPSFLLFFMFSYLYSLIDYNMFIRTCSYRSKTLKRQLFKSLLQTCIKCNKLFPQCPRLFLQVPHKSFSCLTPLKIGRASCREMYERQVGGYQGEGRG